MSESSSQSVLASLAREVPNGGWWSEVSEWSNFELRFAKALESYSGLKSDLQYRDTRIPAEELAASCILSDCTSMYLGGGTQLGVDMDDFVETEWLSESLIQNLNDQFAEVKYGFFYPLGAEGVCNEVEPLIRSGRLIVRPIPALFTTTHEGKRDHVLLEPNLPPSERLIRSREPGQESIPIRTTDVQDPQRKIVSFALPFIANVEFDALAKVLDDESEVLASLRLELKNLVSDASPAGGDLHERFNDQVRPAVEAVERRFRAVTAMHALRISGAALTAISAGLGAISTQGVVSSVSAILGPAGLGLVAKEISDYLGARSELREMPYYLVWRLKRLN